jgi:hypothetical protein
MRAVHANAMSIMLLCVATVAPVIGCAEREGPFSDAALTPQDFGLAHLQCPATGYVLLNPAASTGRFPAAVAVACLGHVDAERPSASFVVASTQPAASAGPMSGWRVRTLKPEQGTYWSTLFTAIPQVREVVMIARRSVTSPQADLGVIAGLAQRDRANFCFVYAPATAESAEAALGGVLVDTQTGALLAYVRAEAGPTDFEPRADDRSRHDHRNSDSDYIVERKLQAQLRQCVMELIAHDQPLSGREESPYQALATQPARPQVIVVPMQSY